MRMTKSWAIAGVLLAGCAFGRSDAPERSAVQDMAPPAPPAAPGAAMRAEEQGAYGGRAMGKSDDGDAKGGEAAPEQPKQPRMMHYNGYARLRVDSPRKSADEASALVLAAGGFVEQLAETSVTLRVPVARFKELFAALLKLGEVVDKSVTAHDVTEAFTAIELRLATARLSRDRLIQLLAKAKSEREKLDLLREIQRLSLEIEGLESAQKTIASLAAMSRITLTLEERRQNLASPSDEPIAAFRWIHELGPFRRDVAFAGKKLQLELPKGFVALDDKQHWIAESADGAVFWASRRDNAPEGNTRYWADALKHRLAPEFGKVEEQTLGQFVVLRFLDRGDTPYRYLLAVHVDDKTIELAEAYFPSEDLEKRYGAAVSAAITKGKQ